MKWFLKVSALSFLAILFTGCIEMHTVITVKKDGSGLVEENIFIGKAIIDMFKEFAAAFADSTQPPQEFNMFEEDKIKQLNTKMDEYSAKMIEQMKKQTAKIKEDTRKIEQTAKIRNDRKEQQTAEAVETNQ